VQNGRQLKAIIIGQPDYSATAYMFVNTLLYLVKNERIPALQWLE